MPVTILETINRCDLTVLSAVVPSSRQPVFIRLGLEKERGSDGGARMQVELLCLVQSFKNGAFAARFWSLPLAHT